MSVHVSISFLSSALERLGAAAIAPSLLAHLTAVTADDYALRARVMSYFELSLLAGFGLVGLAGSQRWPVFGTIAVAVVHVGGFGSLALACAWICRSGRSVVGRERSAAQGMGLYGVLFKHAPWQPRFAGA